ncbi:hypothetical protein COCOBI_02-6570 [Coccomyxa sp. Obi]|nr:hypothetical protein COCOBI_02-6570 [Coccomyxa sp. Obi]
MRLRPLPLSVNKGLVLAYIKWPDIAVGVQWNVNGCREEPVLPMEPAFGEKIEAFKLACSHSTTVSAAHLAVAKLVAGLLSC